MTKAQWLWRRWYRVAPKFILAGLFALAVALLIGRSGEATGERSLAFWMGLIVFGGMAFGFTAGWDSDAPFCGKSPKKLRREQDLQFRDECRAAIAKWKAAVHEARGENWTPPKPPTAPPQPTPQEARTAYLAQFDIPNHRYIANGENRPMTFQETLGVIACFAGAAPETAGLRKWADAQMAKDFGASSYIRTRDGETIPVYRLGGRING